MIENFNHIRTMFKQNFPLVQNIIDTLEKHIDQLPFPHNLKVITNNKGELFLEPDNELTRTTCKCMSRLSVKFAGADDIKQKLTNRISNIYGAIKVDSI